MPAADGAVTVAEANTLFRPLVRTSALVLATSGGPDSTALMFLVARWASALKSQRPKLLAVTVDHGLRPESADEANAVKRLARRLGVAHRTVRWEGAKPKTGLQQAARAARYRLLAAAARTAKADCVLTAHTLDDQAETVLIRMSRGSGLSGLCAMADVSPMPTEGDPAVTLVRPLLGVPKARLIATLARAKIDFAHDPSNQDPRFTRTRLRGLMPMLAQEGLDARRLARLARRLRRANAAIEAAVDEAERALSGPWSKRGPITIPVEKFARLPTEVALRFLGRAIARIGDEGPVELGKLEALHEALVTASKSKTSRKSTTSRRTLAGALVTRTLDTVTIERAPARKSGATGRTALTTGSFARRIPPNGGRMRLPETGK